MVGLNLINLVFLKNNKQSVYMLCDSPYMVWIGIYGQFNNVVDAMNKFFEVVISIFNILYDM